MTPTLVRFLTNIFHLPTLRNTLRDEPWNDCPIHKLEGDDILRASPSPAGLLLKASGSVDRLWDTWRNGSEYHTSSRPSHRVLVALPPSRRCCSIRLIDSHLWGREPGQSSHIHIFPHQPSVQRNRITISSRSSPPSAHSPSSILTQPLVLQPHIDCWTTRRHQTSEESTLCARSQREDSPQDLAQRTRFLDTSPSAPRYKLA